jgi:phosphopantothenoylcysteine decarboxylase/phosphopantothenate--cysteine ligase
MLNGKKILLGVTGSIAAYKIAILIRLLVKNGASVKVIMSSSAEEFITPLTLSVLSKNKVYTQFSSNDGSWNNHVELGLWADVMVIAPASANTISKMVSGACDNILMATYLSAKCAVYVAPAMDLDMYKHPSITANLEKIKSYNNHFIISPNSGELASGLFGEGRMAEPEEILSVIEHHFAADKLLLNKKILITAGPTYENIDLVRFVGNYSSGKMGFAIAEELAANGAEVILVTGPTALTINKTGIKRIDVISTEEMFNAANQYFVECDAAIMSAAVADYKPAIVANSKIKKKDVSLTIELKPTVDILASLGKVKKAHQKLIGFALETDNELENAKLKLERKNLDFIVLNSLNNQGAGFKHDTNKISIINKTGAITHFDLKSKSEVAKDIISTCLL